MSERPHTGVEFILVGGGGHARVVCSILQRHGAKISGYTAPEAGDHMPCAYLGTDEVLLTASGSKRSIALGVGLPRVNEARNALLTQLLQQLDAPVIIAASATVPGDIDIGPGSVVFDGAIIATGSTIGQGCIINHNASVDHDCTIGNNVHIGPGATLCGNVRVGDHCLIGAGSTILPDVGIGSGSTIAAGATVTRTAEGNALYAGCPAKRLK